MLVALLVVTPMAAQTSVPTFIKGTIDVRYNTRVTPDTEGVTDKYTLNINVSNSAQFRGTIDFRPLVKKTFGENQRSAVIYNIDCDIVNPNNPAQTRNVGKLVGNVPVDENNVYRFQEGDLKINVFAMGSAQAFEGKYTGLALGKPPAKKGWFNTITDAVNITSNKVTIAVTKYDKMEFQNHELCVGPVAIYPTVRVNGEMLYDYNRSAWYLRNIAAVYSSTGQAVNDTLSGNIRWVESPNRKTNGEGEYQFDIRVNEPPASEAALFTGPADESAFFANDVKIPGLVGTMKYKDTMSKGTVTSSVITVDLVGNQLTKQQTMYLFKLLLLSSVVPLNAE